MAVATLENAGKTDSTSCRYLWRLDSRNNFLEEDLDPIRCDWRSTIVQTTLHQLDLVDPVWTVLATMVTQLRS